MTQIEYKRHQLFHKFTSKKKNDDRKRRAQLIVIAPNTHTEEEEGVLSENITKCCHGNAKSSSKARVEGGRAGCELQKLLSKQVQDQFIATRRWQ